MTFSANRDEVPKTDRELQSRAKTSKVVMAREPDGSGGWRNVIKMSTNKFDDEAKQIFLDNYQIHARMGDAAASAGVVTLTVRRAMKRDQEFAQGMMIAEEMYKDRLVAHHQDLVFNGTTRRQYDKEGNMVGEEQIFSTPLILAELRKHDAGYRDKREIGLTVTAGVMVAPPEVTLEEWEAKFGRKIEEDPENIIDGTSELLGEKLIDDSQVPDD